MLTDFKDYSSLQQFAEAQTNIINDLQKKILFLEEKNKSLESIINNSNISLLDVIPIPITNQELISREQLELLKITSASRELTLEECKKVSEYTKILKDIDSQNKSIPSTAKRLSSQELLKQLNNVSE